MKRKRSCSIVIAVCLMFVLSGCTSTSNDLNKKSNVISEKEAKQIALEKVPGAVETDIKDFHVENKRNFVEYEGKIIYNGKEYEFEIDGQDGTVLEWEAEEVK